MPKSLALNTRSLQIGNKTIGMRCDGATTNPSLFYIQPLDWAESLVDDNIKQGSQTIENAHVGQPCIAQFEDDWFRGQITSIIDDKVKFVLL